MYYTDHFTTLLHAHTLLYERNLHMSSVGCVSVRLEDQCLLMTPTDLHPLLLTPASIIESIADLTQDHFIYTLHRTLYRTYAPLSIASALPKAATTLISCRPLTFLKAIPHGMQMIQVHPNTDGSFSLPAKSTAPALVYVEGIGFAALADSPLACVYVLEQLEHICRIALDCALLNLTEQSSRLV